MSALDKTVKDIKSMKIRGALDIAVAAVEAMGSVVCGDAKDTADLAKKLAVGGKKLKSSRPTAISLPNAVNYILYLSDKSAVLPLDAYRKIMAKNIELFIKEQNEAIKKIGVYGANLIQDGDVVLTHCNSDTVVSVLAKAKADKKKIQVVCTETRPRYQGHLTAKAVSSLGIPTTLIIDSAVHLMMKKLEVDKVIVGADTVCANGDLINKIGTSQVALCAKELDIDFIVATESIKFSPQSVLGSIVEIEDRGRAEVLGKTKMPKVKIRNPAFDVTNAEYIDMIVTEYGVMPPQGAYQLLKEKFGWELPI